MLEQIGLNTSLRIIAMPRGLPCWYSWDTRSAMTLSLGKSTAAPAMGEHNYMMSTPLRGSASGDMRRAAGIAYLFRHSERAKNEFPHKMASIDACSQEMALGRCVAQDQGLTMATSSKYAKDGRRVNVCKTDGIKTTAYGTANKCSESVISDNSNQLLLHSKA